MIQSELDAVTVTVAGPEDAADLARLVEAFDRVVLTPEVMRHRLAAVAGLETVFLARVQGQAVGFASLRLAPYISGDGPRAELAELFIEGAYRRQGIGRALVDAVEEAARVAGAEAVLLLTGLSNESAQAFYRAIGYSSCALAMRKWLPAEPAGSD